jgi:hypothetical protein
VEGSAKSKVILELHDNLFSDKALEDRIEELLDHKQGAIGCEWKENAYRIDA